jgi:hypothetical protein
MKNRTFSAAAGLVVCAVLAGSNTAAAQPAEPIAFIGHGVMFDEAGRQIQATPAFIERAQAYYIQTLSARLRPVQKNAFDAERNRHLDTYKRLSPQAGAVADPQGALVVNAALIDWLIKAVPPADAGDLESKNNLMKARLRQRLFAPQLGAPYAAPAELLNLLKNPAADAGKN